MTATLQMGLHAAIFFINAVTLFLVVRIGVSTFKVIHTFNERLLSLESRDAGRPD